ncbi:MAG: isocitrate lyase/phosphoenolpyruvate mutase family protein [Pseudomonadota bacterium]
MTIQQPLESTPAGSTPVLAAPVLGRASALRRQLRQRLADAGKTLPALIAPGIYDGFGARMLAEAGFEAAYMTGNGVSACLLGRPDVGLVDLSLISAHARRVAACIDLPLICDADTGYGGVVGVRRTVEEFEAAGVAAIHIEDQVSPKRCAQLPGARTVLDFSSAVAKIEAAVAARTDPDFIVIGRTDSAAGFGLAEAIRRAQAFEQAGAGAVFVELKGHAGVLDDIRRVADALSIPCMVNIDAGGPLAGLHASELHTHGIALAIYPGILRNSVGFAMREALGHLKQDGHTGAARARMLTAQDYNASLGLAEVEAWEARFPD